VGTRCTDHVTPLYPQKLALTSPTGGGRSVGIVSVRTKATEFLQGTNNNSSRVAGLGKWVSRVLIAGKSAVDNNIITLRIALRLYMKTGNGKVGRIEN